MHCIVYMTAEVHKKHSKSSQFLPQVDRKFHSTLTPTIVGWKEETCRAARSIRQAATEIDE